MSHADQYTTFPIIFLEIALVSSAPNDIEVPAVAEQSVTPTAPVEPPAATPIEDTRATTSSAESEEEAIAVVAESEPPAPITASSHLAGTLRVRAMEMIRVLSPLSPPQAAKSCTWRYIVFCEVLHILKVKWHIVDMNF